MAKWTHARSRCGAPIKGLGIGEGTLAPVTILGETVATYQDGTQSFGTKSNVTGKYSSETGNVRTFIPRYVKETERRTRIYWAAEGYVTITPYVWQESVSIGGAVRIPLSFQGTYTTTGTWKIGNSATSTTRAAPSSNSGHHIIEDRYHSSESGVFPSETQGYTTFTHTARLAVTKPYKSVTWYLKDPGDTAPGYGSTTMHTEKGNGQKKTSNLSYIFTDSRATGAHTVTVSVAFYSSPGQVYTYNLQVDRMGSSDYDSNPQQQSGPTSPLDQDDETDSGEANVPDRPGSFTLSPRRVSILLRWQPSASDGGSPITRYEYQYQSGNYNREKWSEWSDWTSAGTGNSTWITRLSSGVNYAVRMRAVNDEGYSNHTGIVITRTTE